MTTKFYDHWRDVPNTAWRWPNFSPAEIASRGDGKLLINEAALDRLQALRDRLGKPLIVRSAYRSPEHNRSVGGAKRSKHLIGAAFFIAMENHDPQAREVLAESRTMKGGGAAGVATLGAAGVEVAQNVLAATQSAILPLLPYLDTLRWLYIAVALIGVSVTIYARWDDLRKGRR